jgi:fatty acid desaturase
MSHVPERLDIQVRRATTRRRSRSLALAVSLVLLGISLYRLWAGAPWHWWYIPVFPLWIGLIFLISRLDGDAMEEITRSFWRPPS